MLTASIAFTFVSKLVCSNCNKPFNIDNVNTYAVCCDQPLTAIYDLSHPFSISSLVNRPLNMWRYREMLPVKNEKNIVSLGEGMTPIFNLDKLGNKYGFSNLQVKDESFNPTGSFKARGLSMAVSKAKELSIDRCIVPTAGNAGGALAAYCAKADIECTVVMPTHTPEMFKEECKLYGAELILVDGLINDCAVKVQQLKTKKDYFDVSTLKEPYRLEGKKTMGYEIAEQFKWELPDVIIYPAGGGTGLIGIWKAFKELQEMGIIHYAIPRMIAVQSANCAPVVEAMKDPVNWKEHFHPKASIANGLAVPYPFGMKMMLRVIKESGGTAISISEEDIITAMKEIAQVEGMLVAPEGAAVWKAVRLLRDQHKIASGESILMLNTGSGYKYLEGMSRFF